MKKLILIFFLASTFQFLNAQERQVYFPKQIPEFSILAEDGSEFTEKDLTKKKNLVFIYFNPGCFHCETAFKTLNLNYQNLNIEGVKIYLVSAGSVQDTKVFMKQLAPNLLKLDNFEVIYDEDYRFADAFSVGVFPHSFLYDKKGKLIDSYPGEQRIIEPFKVLLKK